MDALKSPRAISRKVNAKETQPFDFGWLELVSPDDASIAVCIKMQGDTSEETAGQVLGKQLLSRLIDRTSTDPETIRSLALFLQTPMHVEQQQEFLFIPTIAIAFNSAATADHFLMKLCAAEPLVQVSKSRGESLLADKYGRYVFGDGRLAGAACRHGESSVILSEEASLLRIIHMGYGTRHLMEMNELGIDLNADVLVFWDLGELQQQIVVALLEKSLGGKPFEELNREDVASSISRGCAAVRLDGRWAIRGYFQTSAPSGVHTITSFAERTRNAALKQANPPAEVGNHPAFLGNSILANFFADHQKPQNPKSANSRPIVRFASIARSTQGPSMRDVVLSLLSAARDRT